MTPLFGTLDFIDFLIIGLIVATFAGGGAFTRRQVNNLSSLERQMRSLQAKLDALLKHQGIPLPPPPPSGLSPELERIAADPNRRIEAIRLYREQNPGVGLVEAKAKIEAFAENHP